MSSFLSYIPIRTTLHKYFLCIQIEAKDIGPLVKIRAGHDGSGMFAGWFLDKILIQRHPSQKSHRRGAKKKGNKGKTPELERKSSRIGRKGAASSRAGTSLRGGSSTRGRAMSRAALSDE